VRSEAGAVAALAPILVALVLLFAGLAGDAGAYLYARSRAQTAADAAALAAAPLTFRSFGAGSSAGEAAAFAAANGAELVTCECPTDRSWRSRTVEVEVTVAVNLLLLPATSVRATGRAVFTPTRLAG